MRLQILWHPRATAGTKRGLHTLKHSAHRGDIKTRFFQRLDANAIRLKFVVAGKINLQLLHQRTAANQHGLNWVYRFRVI